MARAQSSNAERLRQAAQSSGTEIGNGADPDQAIDNPEVREAIARTFERVQDLAERRKAVNADIRAEFERLEARGLNKFAVKDLYRRYVMNDKDRAGYDVTIITGRKAIGDPIQASLFAESPESGAVN